MLGVDPKRACRDTSPLNDPFACCVRVSETRLASHEVFSFHVPSSTSGQADTNGQVALSLSCMAAGAQSASHAATIGTSLTAASLGKICDKKILTLPRCDLLGLVRTLANPLPTTGVEDRSDCRARRGGDAAEERLPYQGMIGQSDENTLGG